MSPGEFWEALRAYRDEKAADRRHLGELARGLGVRIVNLFVKKPVRKVEAFWPMPWDGNTADDIAADLNTMSREEREALAREYIKKTDQFFNTIGDGIGNDSSEP